MEAMDIFTGISNLFKQKQPPVQGSLLPPPKVQDAIIDGIVKLKTKSEKIVDYSPWLENETYEVIKINELEFYIYYCFLLDVYCSNRQVSDSARMFLTRAIENLLIAGLVVLNGERNTGVAIQVYESRNKLYSMHLIAGDANWMSKGLDDLLSNIMVSTQEGKIHLNPGIPISDPMSRLLNLTILADDFVSSQNLIDIDYISSLALAIKNSETN